MNLQSETKKCTKCLETKSIDCFSYKDKKNNIRKYVCKDCDKTIRRKYYLDNKDRIIDKVLDRNRKIRLNSYKFIWEYLLENPCVDCGEDNPIVLEFDHKEGTDKKDSVCRIVSDGNSIDKIKEEILKCDVRCCNCHRVKTAKQLNWYSYLK